LVNGNSEKLPFKSKKFDRILIGDLLEHLLDPESCLKEVNRILKNQGFVVITVPNLGFYGARFYFLLHGHVYNFENSQNPPWKWQHIRFYNLKILMMLLKTSGFKIKKVYKTPIKVDIKIIKNIKMIPWFMVLLLIKLLQILTRGKLVNTSDVLVILARKM
jgi:ubiquinone/menaquinone biosynthesis C-methylase UbiE